ncbi:MAG: NAD-dependent epimerase/dehydratase family protein [Candidatus Dormibacteraeota bacterium]|nr:NAD-dependent epimerase/dehydratase family protein [Candidatus Dormibacteraeota bacterium]
MTGQARVVVTGGAGFVGVHSVEALLADGCAVLVIDNLSHPSDRALPGSCDVVVRDVREADARAALIAFSPTAVLHLAAQGGVNRSWRDPAADARINVQGTVSVLDAAREGACPRVVMASSGGALYGAAEELPSDEDTRAQPRSPYGTAKWAVEQYLGYFARAGAFATLALRYGNVYGPGQDGTGEAGVVAITSVRLVNGEAPIVRGSGEQTRDFVYVGDVVRANVAAVHGAATGAVNIGTGRETSVNRVVETLCAAAGFQGAPDHVDMPPGEVSRSCLDVSRAGTLLGWAPGVDVEKGLFDTYAHFAQKASAR